MTVHEIRVLAGVEENPHLENFKKPLEEVGVTYHLFDSPPDRAPLAYLFNGNPKPEEVVGLANIEKAIENVLNNP